MDVNSNSHAEQSRNDTHVKDIRPGTLMHHKEKKVTSGVCKHATRSWHNLLSFKTNLISCVLFFLTPPTTAQWFSSIYLSMAQKWSYGTFCESTLCVSLAIIQGLHEVL